MPVYAQPTHLLFGTVNNFARHGDFHRIKSQMRRLYVGGLFILKRDFVDFFKKNFPPICVLQKMDFAKLKAVSPTFGGPSTILTVIGIFVSHFTLAIEGNLGAEEHEKSHLIESKRLAPKTVFIKT